MTGKYQHINRATKLSLTYHAQRASQTLCAAQPGERAETFSKYVADHATGLPAHTASVGRLLSVLAGSIARPVALCVV